MSLHVLAGNTIRITNTFYNFDKQPTDPNIVKVRVYDQKYNILTDFSLGEANRISTGKYFYDYHTHTEPNKKYIVEFYGEIAGNPTFDREVIIATFLKE